MPRVKKEYLDDVLKLEPDDSESEGKWRGFDDLLGQAQPSNLEPLNMDMNDLLDFEPCPIRHKSRTPMKQPKQGSPRLGTNIMPRDDPNPSSRALSPLPPLAPSPARVFRDEVIDLTDETLHPQIRPEPGLYTEARKRALNEPRTMQKSLNNLNLRPSTSTSKNVKLERSEDMHKIQTLYRKLPAAPLHKSATDVESERDVAQYGVPPSRQGNHNDPRTAAAVTAKLVSKRGLGQRRFLKKLNSEPESTPLTTPDSIVENATSAPSQSRRRKAIKEEHPPLTFKLRKDEENLAQATSELGVTYLDDFQDMLPSTAPADHPHLISIADHILPEMNVVEMVGLNLPDVVVSILYHYASDSQDIITKFLEKDTTNHFFFFFISRSDKWYSWSIEREESKVTVGIERSTRPHNDKSQSPSNGQTDFYLQYELKRSLKHTSPRFTLLSALMPKVPTPREFLFNASTTRGAQQHVNYTSRLQPPADGVRALAQYMWFSAFRASAMEADFQVAYGRKVRYDHVIGRIRATYEYALKGAKTQALKRAQGLYNVPTLKTEEGRELIRKRKFEDAMLDDKEEYVLEGEADYE